MTSTFDIICDFVISLEGGYVFDKDDPGGETKYGISKRSYPKLDIKNLTIEDAKKIYKKDYWDSIKCDLMSQRLCVVMFDCAVNQGPRNAIQLFQEASGIEPDGIIGNKTISAYIMCDDDIIFKFVSARLNRYRITNNFSKFGRGWIDRMSRVIYKLTEFSK